MTSRPVSIVEASRLLGAMEPWLVYAENTTSRHAFYEAGSEVDRGWFRYGKLGSMGTRKSCSPYEALEKVRAKAVGDYVVGVPEWRWPDGQSARAVAPKPSPPRRVPTLRERVNDTTMRPTTLFDWMDLVAQMKMRRLLDDTTSLRDAFPHCTDVTLWSDSSHRLYVVTRYPDDSLVCGMLK